MGIILSVVFIVVILCFYVNIKTKEQEEERARKYRQSEENKLRNEFPDGYWYFKNRLDKRIMGLYSSPIMNERSTDEIVSLKTEIKAKQEEINSARKEAAEKDDLFVAEQKKFSDYCISIAKIHLSKCGRYSYPIPWEKRNLKGERIKCEQSVWQIFVDSLCLDQNLDYTLLPGCKANFDNLSEFKDKTRHWNPHVYKGINDFLEELAKQYPIGIFFNTSIVDWNEDALLYHYENISRKIPDTQIIDNAFDWLFSSYILDKVRISTSIDVKYLVIIDCFTENATLIEKCKNIFKLANHPCVIYLSLLKCFDSIEMQKWIEDKQKEHEKEERKRNALASLRHSVSTWDCVKNIPYYYFYHYYPKRFDDITIESENVRNLIYQFKDGLGDSFSIVSDMMEKKLKSTFSNDDMALLTLVCIPASTVQDNENRYLEFSDKLCTATGMKNGFAHITIIKEKHQSHLGGTDKAEYSYDKDFFRGAFVLLFDDVVTRGRSMEQMKSDLESIGATVVCALSIGRTYSDYHGDNRTPHPWTGNY